MPWHCYIQVVCCNRQCERRHVGEVELKKGRKIRKLMVIARWLSINGRRKVLSARIVTMCQAHNTLLRATLQEYTKKYTNSERERERERERVREREREKI